MDMIETRPVLPRSDGVEDLKLALHGNLTRAASRVNRTVPKDGSEDMDAISYSHFVAPLLPLTINNDIDIGTGTGLVLLEGTDPNFTFVTGIAGGADNDPGGGRWIRLHNARPPNPALPNIGFFHNNVASLQENRLLLENAATVSLAPRETIQFWYDKDVSRWRHCR